MIDILVNLVKSIGMVSLAGLLSCCPVSGSSGSASVDQVEVKEAKQVQVYCEEVQVEEWKLCEGEEF